ncbi:MAG: hypothetical protein D6805_05045 [Planctomycetota bacterium]|nr:MAG: hypothetical protein D6805_05045 [Planctomycetota bacterium]
MKGEGKGVNDFWPGERYWRRSISHPLQRQIGLAYRRAGEEGRVFFVPGVYGERVVYQGLFEAMVLDVSLKRVLWRYRFPMELGMPERFEAMRLSPAVSADGVFMVFRRLRRERYLSAEKGGEEVERWEPFYGLVALDWGGKERWSSWKLEGLRGIFEGAYGVSSPVYAYGNLYFTVVYRRKNFDFYLYCLDARSGRVRWRNMLVSGLPDNPFGLRSVAASPLVRDGWVFTVSHLGVASCVDAFSGETRWSYRYPLRVEGLFRERVEAGGLGRLSSGWLVGDVFVFAPWDGDDVLGLEVGSGRLLWRFWRGELLGGVADGGRVYVADRGGLMALEGRSGRVLWRVELPVLVGEMVLRGEELYYSSREDLYRISVLDGRVLGRYLWEDREREPGNLFFVGGRLGVISWEEVSFFEGFSFSLQRLRLAMRRSPHSGYPTWRLCMLYYKHRDYAKALRYGRLAYKQFQDVDEFAQKRLLQVLYYLLRREGDRLYGGGRYAQALGLYREAEKVARRGSYIFSLLRRQAECYLALSRWSEALACYQRILRRCRLERYSLPFGGKVEAGVYAQLKIKELITRYGRRIYEGFEREAQALLRRGDRYQLKHLWERILSWYPNSRAAREAFFRLARYYEQRKQRTLAIRVWERFLGRYAGDIRSARILWRVARLYHELGRYEEAMDVLMRLERRYGKLVEGGESWGQRVRKRLALSEYRFLSRRSSLRFPLSLLWRTHTRIPRFGQQPQIWIYKVPSLRYVFLVQNGVLECRQLRTGILRWRWVLPRGVRVHEGGGRMGGIFLLPTARYLYALDMVDGRLRWRFRFSLPGRTDLDEEIGLARILGGRLILLVSRSGALAMLEGSGGKVVWRGQLPQRDVVGLYGEGGVIFFLLRKPAQLLGLEWRTGKKVFHKYFYRHAKKVGLISALNSSMAEVSISYRLEPVVGGGRLWLVLGEDMLVCFSLKFRRVVWTRRFIQGIHQLRYLASMDYVLVGLEVWSVHFYCLRGENGLEVWRYRTFELSPKRLESDGFYLYILSGGYRNFKIYALDIVHGRKRWHWGAPLGMRFEELYWENRHLVLPYMRERSGKVYILSKRRNGATKEILDFKGKRILDIFLVGGYLVLATDRGCMAYGFLDRELAKRRVVELGERVLRHSEDWGSVQRLAQWRFALGEVRLAYRLLERKLLDWEGEELVRERLWEQMLGYREALVEGGKGRVFLVHRRYFPLRVDGLLRDWWPRILGWSLDAPFSVWNVQHRSQSFSNWEGEEDLSGRIYMAWDERYFYFALKVYDDVLQPYDPEASDWRGDCLVIALDFDGSGGSVAGLGDSMMTLALQVPQRKKKAQREAEEKRRPKGKYFVKRSEDETATIYEVALPWEMFRKNRSSFLSKKRKIPYEGLEFRMNLVVTDDDGDGRGAVKSLQLAPGLRLHKYKNLWYYFVPDDFARIRLVK